MKPAESSETLLKSICFYSFDTIVVHLKDQPQDREAIKEIVFGNFSTIIRSPEQVQQLLEIFLEAPNEIREFTLNNFKNIVGLEEPNLFLQLFPEAKDRILELAQTLKLANTEAVALQELCRQRETVFQTQKAESVRLAKAQELYQLCKSLCKEGSCETEAIINGKKAHIKISTKISRHGTHMCLIMDNSTVRLHATKEGKVKFATLQAVPLPLSIQNAEELIVAIKPESCASSSDAILQHAEGSSTAQDTRAPSLAPLPS